MSMQPTQPPATKSVVSRPSEMTEISGSTEEVMEVVLDVASPGMALSASNQFSKSVKDSSERLHNDDERLVVVNTRLKRGASTKHPRRTASIFNDMRRSLTTLLSTKLVAVGGGRWVGPVSAWVDLEPKIIDAEEEFRAAYACWAADLIFCRNIGVGVSEYLFGRFNVDTLHAGKITPRTKTNDEMIVAFIQETSRLRARDDYHDSRLSDNPNDISPDGKDYDAPGAKRYISQDEWDRKTLNMLYEKYAAILDIGVITPGMLLSGWQYLRHVLLDKWGTNPNDIQFAGAGKGLETAISDLVKTHGYTDAFSELDYAESHLTAAFSHYESLSMKHVFSNTGDPLLREYGADEIRYLWPVLNVYHELMAAFEQRQGPTHLDAMLPYNRAICETVFGIHDRVSRTTSVAGGEWLNTNESLNKIYERVKENCSLAVISNIAECEDTLLRICYRVLSDANRAIAMPENAPMRNTLQNISIKCSQATTVKQHEPTTVNMVPPAVDMSAVQPGSIGAKQNARMEKVKYQSRVRQFSFALELLSRIRTQTDPTNESPRYYIANIVQLETFAENVTQGGGNPFVDPDLSVTAKEIARVMKLFDQDMLKTDENYRSVMHAELTKLEDNIKAHLGGEHAAEQAVNEVGQAADLGVGGVDIDA